MAVLERLLYLSEWQIAALLAELALVGAALLAAARRLSHTA